MKMKTSDVLLLLVGLVIIFFSYQELGALFFKSGSKVIYLGSISNTKGTVKTKNTLGIEWQEALTGQELTENQFVSTDFFSEAEINMTRGDEVVMGEKSLVQFFSVGKIRGIEVKRGFIRLKLDGRGPVILKIRREEYLLSTLRADVQIYFDGKKGEIGVLSGEVRLERDGLLEILDNKISLEIDGDELIRKPISFQLISPQRHQFIYSNQNITPILLKWAPAQSSRVVYSSDPEFKTEENLEGFGEVSLKLKSGAYYWKVEGRAGHSLRGQFYIVEEVSPKIIRPIDGESVFLMNNDGTPTLVLQWHGDAHQKYLVEWQDRVLHRDIVEGPRSFISVSDKVKLKWRVKIENLNRPDALWSKWQDISAEVINPPKTPQSLFPNDVEYLNYSKPFEKVLLNWNSESLVDLELRSGQGLQKIYRMNLRSRELSLDQGDYEWRVREQDKLKRLSHWSDWGKFRVIDASSERSIENTLRLPIRYPNRLAQFKWKKSGHKKFLFELAYDEEFKNLIHEEVLTSNFFEIPISVIGTYYWRCSLILQSGKKKDCDQEHATLLPSLFD